LVSANAVPSANFAIIIPARFASTRYPGKPLVGLRGAGGIVKSLIQRSWECARAVSGNAGVWIATDDDRIAEEVSRFGGEVIMTSVDCANGTERCAEAAAKLGHVADIFVNLQGDAPLSPTLAVEKIVDRLQQDAEAAVSTPAIRCSSSMYRHLLDDQAEGRVGGTTAVFNTACRALYFSKRIIPFVPQDFAADHESVPVFLHLGLYAYRRAALEKYCMTPASRLEQLEGLEQLRFLELDLPVSVVEIGPLRWDIIELNNPSDVPSIERVLAERGID
jgi:3-deoxy-manno-octulosonate cytidylyltransferase (CMP-KDO synthetase)